MRVISRALASVLGVLLFCSANASDDLPSAMPANEAVILANIAYQDGQYAVAACYYLVAARVTGDEEMAENAARSAARADDVDILKEAGRLWSELQPQDIAAAEFLARVYTDVGELDEAVVQLDRIRRSYEGGADIGFDSLVPYLQRERNRRVAVALMQRLIVDHEKTPAAIYGLAYMQARARLFDDALVSINRALDLEQNSSRSIRFKSDVLLALGRRDEALAFLKKSVERLDQHALRVHYARALRLNGAHDEAIRQYKIAVFDQNSTDEEDFISLGSLLYEQQRYDEAVAVYLKLAKFNPDMPQPWFYLAEIAELQGDIDSALEWYSKVPESQFYVEARKKRAILLAKQGDLKAARRQISDLRALNYFGVNVELALLEGGLLQQAGQPKAAKDIYDAGVEASPYDQELLLARAVLAKNQGDQGYFESELKKLIDNDPVHGDSLSVLGVSLAQQSRYYEARQYLEPLSKMRPTDTTVASYYGEVLWHEGEKTAAERIWAQGLLVNPHSQLLHTMTERYAVESAAE